MLLSELLNPIISLLSYVLCSGSKVKITERLEYRLPSLTCKVLITTQPSYLHELIAVQPPRSTHSPSVATLARPPTPPSLRITDCTFRLCFTLSLKPVPFHSVTSFQSLYLSLTSSYACHAVFLCRFITFFIHNPSLCHPPVSKILSTVHSSSVRIDSTDYLSHGSFLLSYIGFVFCSFLIFFLCVWFSAV